MPIERKAYSCEFGCARRVLTSRKSMLKHEETCFLNPKRKACKTCANDQFKQEECVYGHKTPRFDCPDWEPAADVILLDEDEVSP